MSDIKNHNPDKEGEWRVEEERKKSEEVQRCQHHQRLFIYP
jgi:hypothetical protein